MNKNAASNGKKLALRVETLRNLNAKEMSQIQGGFINMTCTSVFVPVTGITLTYAIETTYCN
jgi:bacteriocin-like protein